MLNSLNNLVKELKKNNYDYEAIEVLKNYDLLERNMYNLCYYALEPLNYELCNKDGLNEYVYYTFLDKEADYNILEAIEDVNRFLEDSYYQEYDFFVIDNDYNEVQSYNVLEEVFNYYDIASEIVDEYETNLGDYNNDFISFIRDFYVF